MLTEILVSICALVFLYLSYKYAVARPTNFPPGPPRIPFFGSYLFMMLANSKYLHKGVLSFSKFYKSDIVGFHVGPFPVVAVHSAEGVHAVLNNSDFDGRPGIYLAQMRDPELQIRGIFFHEGPVWKEQRRFMLRFLRDYGFGRRHQGHEQIVQDNMTELLQLIRQGPRHRHEQQLVHADGYRILLPTILSPMLINCLFDIILNEQVPCAEQANFVKLAHMMFQFQRNGDDFGKILSIMPWVRHIFPNWSAYNKLMQSNNFIHKYFGDIVDRHIESYEEDNERNFLDLYIKEMKQAQANGTATETTFQREQFVMGIADFTLPAATAVTAQISFMVQYMLLDPEIQQRIQQEVDEVVGNVRLPTLDDRLRMPYTDAAIRECMRIETVVPSDVPHKALVDTQLLGYNIPKDTVVIPSLFAYHSDERVWGDPMKFRPERFLDEAGKLSLKQDVSLPFGGGKRLCAGETFARNMQFLLVATLLQNFSFILGPNDDLPDINKNLNGIIITPPDFWVQLKERT